ncbi:DNA polymerase epsilon subunit 3 [Salarias fasciatus]|uniref:DNA polymerase epsilon subunit 3 n=1 Tax=Salarias fasciatus TaxID=181472 RepID=A0A672JQQ3_SALFA|nr:DNA polymerase epsilon subunit 3 [Salarias fasciatus]
MAERPEDLNLPNAVITRIIKEALPDGVNVSKEARRAISQAASVFVLYATSCANNFAMKAKRKTLNAGDVLAAMEEMEFERFLEPLREALEVYKKGQKGKKEVSEQRRRDKEEKKAGSERDKSREEEEEEEDEEEDERMEEEAEAENEAAAADEDEEVDN